MDFKCACGREGGWIINGWKLKTKKRISRYKTVLFSQNYSTVLRSSCWGKSRKGQRCKSNDTPLPRGKDIKPSYKWRNMAWKTTRTTQNEKPKP